MKKRWMKVLIVSAGLFVLLHASVYATADCRSPATSGPTNGWLVIDGGGTLLPEVIERFVALAGGPNAKFVFIPTAKSDAEIDLDELRSAYPKWFHVKNAIVLHTRDRTRANSEDFAEPIRGASAVWFDGGRQWRLADAYLGTAVQREINALLARGGVVGGGSAGASIQASFLLRGAPATPQDPNGDSRIVMSPGHEVGLGLLTNSAIDQHVDARDRQDALDSVLSAHPGLLGIGIDQKAAIVVHGDRFFVVGGSVYIHDGKEHDGEPFYILAPKTGFDLKTRSIDAVGGEQFGYGWVLEVKTAARYISDGREITKGTGKLGWRDDPKQPAKAINFECNVAVFSMGDNLYAAKLNGQQQITIKARDLNSDELRDYTCKY